MREKETIHTILGQIKDPAVRTVAEHSLRTSRKAMDMGQRSRIQFVIDEIHKIMPKALKIRSKNETS